MVVVGNRSCRRWLDTARIVNRRECVELVVAVTIHVCKVDVRTGELVAQSAGNILGFLYEIIRRNCTRCEYVNPIVEHIFVNGAVFVRITSSETEFRSCTILETDAVSVARTIIFVDIVV